MSWDINGHDWAVELLKGQVARGEVRHAYLLCGPDGVGRRTLALRFAQALCCQNPPAPGEACGECRPCRNIKNLSHTDLLVVERQADKTQILMEQVQKLRYDLSLAPFESPYKIGLLLNFEEASDSAQNALLKLLEEAPSRAILLITSQSAEAVLPTVMSRCEILRLRPQAPARLAETLSGWNNESPAVELQLSARLADGCTGRARRLAGDAEWRQKRADLVNTAFEIFGMSRRQRLALAARVFEGSRRGQAKSASPAREPSRGADLNPNREALRQALGVWASLWRDILLCASGMAPHDGDAPAGWELDTPLVNIDCAERVAQAAKQVGFSQARQQIERLETALVNLNPPYHANPRLLGEILLLDWPVI